MQNNRSLTVCTASSRRSRVMQAAPMDVESLFNRLSNSQPLPCTYAAYRALSKAEQDNMKDVGAYIIGELDGGRRKAGCVKSRGAAVLDADNLRAGETEEFVRRVAGLGCCYALHSTAKHSPTTPRLRVVIPFSNDVPAERYSPVVRRLCQVIQTEMTWFDPTCAEATRIMYYPVHCSDIVPVWHCSDGPLLDADALLTQMGDWKDVTGWPRFPREATTEKRALTVAKQQDPEEKKGIVGEFCRVYDIPAAMEKFLPGVYVETATPGRYTFAQGSTAGGAVLYEDGKFLYSHHATDPAGGKLVNAFDLVRLHRFGDLDDEAKEGTKGISLPSYKAMADCARSDPEVAHRLAQAAFSEVFEDKRLTDEEAAVSLTQCSGAPLSLPILRTALRTMGVTARRNLITGSAEIDGMPPQYSAENAINVLPVLLMDLLRGVKVKGVSRSAVMDYLVAVVDENKYNPVVDMLRETTWDGISRFPELLESINIKPDTFYALLLRKWLIQCVALAHNATGKVVPAEGLLTLQGPQGIGKTLFFRRLSLRSDWFAEGATLDMRNKDDIIRATSVWITELGELDSTLKREQASLKAFITQKTDRIRAPYARESSDRPRRTSFCATVNPESFLKDETGDRRFWVIPVKEFDVPWLVDTPEDWFVQLWAEVYVWWKKEPQSFRLTTHERARLNDLNASHREPLPGEETLRLALNFDLPPEQWEEFSASEVGKYLYFSSFRPSEAQIMGRILTKLARDDPRIKSRILRGVKVYRLPLRRQITTIPGQGEMDDKKAPLSSGEAKEG